MSLLSISNLSYNFPDGKALFNDISFSLKNGVTALVGRNGTGKSVLAEIIMGRVQPNVGHFTSSHRIGYFSQLTSPDKQFNNQTLGDYLEISPILSALKRIHNAEYTLNDFDIVDNQWLIESEFQEKLIELGIQAHLSTLCKDLSGGQLSRLLLWRLFQQNNGILILDEPTNHLDKPARQWLLKMMKAYAGSILVITHDQDLLDHVEQFLSLTTKGISAFSGSYKQLQASQDLQLKSIQDALKNAERKEKNIQHSKQDNNEKAQQRSKQGQHLRHSGSQAKSLLDKSKNSAEKSMSSRKIQYENNIEQAKNTVKQLKLKQERLDPINLSYSVEGNKTSLRLENLVLPYGLKSQINFTLSQGEKLHLQGENGSGKSTLLHVINKTIPATSGDIFLKGKAFYIDQHFSLLDETVSLLESFSLLCTQLKEEKIRTLLASIGFRGTAVEKKINTLSGGEKMRTALLIAGNQSMDTLLLLDEPDNHLDIDTKKQLSKTLSRYQGSFILVSHSDNFAQSINLNKQINLTNE